MPGKAMHRQSCFLKFLIGVLILGVISLSLNFIISPILDSTFGQPDSGLSTWQRLRYGILLVWFSDDLTRPIYQENNEMTFIIEPGEDAYTVSLHLEQSKLISNARAFQLFLAWSGKDAYLQPGRYRLSSSLSAISIAELLESASSSEIFLTVLPGWRIEEIAGTLATSGLTITADEFITVAYSKNTFNDLIPSGNTAEGYLFPGTYSLARTTTVDQLFLLLIQEFHFQVIPEYLSGYTLRGLTLHEAVTLASIVQKEAVIESEMPIIASVFLNRLKNGMRLQADPTVQYALGFDNTNNSWWKTPLSYSDLEIDSPFNTYMYAGLPPGPISNPGLKALAAVAYPEDTTFFYFQAQCTGTGYHNFAETLEQHLENNCP